MTKKESIIIIAKKHFSQTGYENTSLEEIAKELKITKPALYYHFKNKSEIYNEIFKQAFKYLPLEKVETIKDYIFVLADFFENDYEIAKMLSMELANNGRNLSQSSIEIVSQTLKKLLSLLDSEINPFFIQTIIVSSLTGYLNTLNLREKVSSMIQIDKKSLSIKEDLYKMIECYIKGQK